MTYVKSMNSTNSSFTGFRNSEFYHVFKSTGQMQFIFYNNSDENESCSHILQLTFVLQDLLKNCLVMDILCKLTKIITRL